MTRTTDVTLIGAAGGTTPPPGALEFLGHLTEVLVLIEATAEGAPVRGVWATDAEIAEQLGIAADDWPPAAEWLTRQGLVLRLVGSSTVPVHFYEPGPGLERLIEATRRSRRRVDHGNTGAAS